MSLKNKYVPLIFDMYYLYDHSFNNKKFISINVDDIIQNKDKLDLVENTLAINFFNKKFNNFQQINDLDKKLYKVKCFYKNNEDSDIDEMYTIVEINSKILESYIDKKKTIPNFDFFMRLCLYHYKYKNSKENNEFESSALDKINKNIDKIIKSTLVPSIYNEEFIEDNDNITFKLFKYQKHSIKWMLNKEVNKSKVYFNINDEIRIGNIYIDLYKRKLYKIHSKESLEFHGGCIIDEVGLGKTLQVTTLSIINNSKDNSYYKSNCLFNSRATLIACPSQLCGQWFRELSNTISEDYKPIIIKILTKRHFDKYTYQNLLDADFVILSFSFLNNKNFISSWTNTSNPYNYNYNYNNVNNLFKDIGQKLLYDPLNSLKNTNAVLPTIFWHRIVIDEFHDIYSNKKYTYVQYILNHFQSNYKWCVTATPFIIKTNLYNMVDFLSNYKNIFNDKIFLDNNIVDYLSNNCFRRNTKKSVENEYILPDINYKTIWLEFTYTERLIYNAYIANTNNDIFSTYLRQLCCHPNLANETKNLLSQCKTLNDIENMMIKHYEIKVNKLKKNNNKIKDKINLLESNIKKKKLKKKIKKKKKNKEQLETEILLDNINNNNIDDINQSEFFKILSEDKYLDRISLDILNKALTKNKNILKDSEKILKGHTITLNFYNNVLNRLKNLDDNNEETCPICIDNLSKNNIGITSCGHLFCYDCLQMCLSKNNTSCPICKGYINKNKIYLLKYNNNNNNNKTNTKKNDLINKVGTKLGNLIFFLKENNEHTIIFSQWDNLLIKIGAILKQYNIKNVFCKGNCYQRDKAIRDFNNNNKIKVIMLSSESAASGTNLTKASTIIFIEPIYGDIKYRTDLESQAIGRAHRLGQKNNIKIIRFIIKNSVEETIHNQNLESENKMIK
jgi:SNF2 family DNA or RNA helicase